MARAANKITVIENNQEAITSLKDMLSKHCKVSTVESIDDFSKEDADIIVTDYILPSIPSKGSMSRLRNIEVEVLKEKSKLTSALVKVIDDSKKTLNNGNGRSVRENIKAGVDARIRQLKAEIKGIDKELKETIDSTKAGLDNIKALKTELDEINLKIEITKKDIIILGEKLETGNTDKLKSIDTLESVKKDKVQADLLAQEALKEQKAAEERLSIVESEKAQAVIKLEVASVELLKAKDIEAKALKEKASALEKAEDALKEESEALQKADDAINEKAAIIEKIDRAKRGRGEMEENIKAVYNEKDALDKTAQAILKESDDIEHIAQAILKEKIEIEKNIEKAKIDKEEALKKVVEAMKEKALAEERLDGETKITQEIGIKVRPIKERLDMMNAELQRAKDTSLLAIAAKEDAENKLVELQSNWEKQLGM
ncbi:MAG: hypothetical protein HQK91_06560 [Nitrospirae bacterium]|nr:hypothetical protein [Nitrospirota bacterium]